jgi:hypothetical protein
MPPCGNPILREHSARTSGNVTLRRECVSAKTLIALGKPTTRFW